MNFHLFDLMGKSYLIKHCLSELKIKRENELFRMYITESLRLKGENKYISASYIDLLSPEKESDCEKAAEEAEQAAEKALDAMKKYLKQEG